MASLQTLRNKGGFIVSVVIGLALVSFLVGDLLSSRSVFFGSVNAGEVDGHDISAQQYTERVNYLTQINEISSGKQAISSEQSDAIANQAWETFVREFAFLPAAEKIGLITTSAELEELFFGAHPSSIISQIFIDPQTGIFNPAMVRELQSNLTQDETGNLSIFWSYLQNEVADMEVVSKFRALTTKAAYTSATMAQEMANLQGKTYGIDFVFQPFTSVADSAVTVTEGDLKKYYDTHKASFKVGENRTLNYVLFETMPSQADQASAAQYIDGLVADFAGAENPMQFARANSQGQTSDRYFSREELNGDMAQYAFSGTSELFGPILNGDTYTIAKISDTKNLPDSLDLSILVLTPDMQSTADSLLKALNSGAEFATAAVKHSLDQQSAIMGGAIGPIDPQTLSKDFSSQLLGATAGQVKMIKSPQSLSLVKVNKVIGGQARVQLAMINYTVEPSETTRNSVYNRANSFALSAQGSVDNFNKAVNDSALIARPATIYPNQRTVPGIQDSRSLVSWAYNNSAEEKVSKVEAFGDTFVVAALMESAQKGYQPFEKVKDQIRSIVLDQKKGELLSAKFSAQSSLSAIAAANGDSVQTASDINFNTFVVPNIGAEPALVGAVCALKDGVLSKPIVGFRGVYSAQIKSATANPVSVEIEQQRLTAEGEQTAFARSYQAFIDMVEITDTRYKLY